MKLLKSLRLLFTILAILLSDALCAAVAYSYCNLQWAARCQGASAPPETAFVLAIPFAAGILLCLGLAGAFHCRVKRAGESGGPA